LPRSGSRVRSSSPSSLYTGLAVIGFTTPEGEVVISSMVMLQDRLYWFYGRNYGLFVSVWNRRYENILKELRDSATTRPLPRTNGNILSAFVRANHALARLHRLPDKQRKRARKYYACAYIEIFRRRFSPSRREYVRDQRFKRVARILSYRLARQQVSPPPLPPKPIEFISSSADISYPERHRRRISTARTPQAARDEWDRKNRSYPRDDWRTVRRDLGQLLWFGR
jgi:hypothetical protein